MSDMTHKTVPVEPKRCPFCGHVGLHFSDGSTFRWLSYSCEGCGMGSETRVQTLGDGTPEQWLEKAKTDAITEWNTRAPIEAAPPSPVTELEVMLYEALRAFRDGGPEGGTDFNGWHQSYEEPCRLAREALAAYEAKKAAPTNYQKHLAVRAEIEGRSHDD